MVTLPDGTSTTLQQAEGWNFAPPAVSSLTLQQAEGWNFAPPSLTTLVEEVRGNDPTVIGGPASGNNIGKDAALSQSGQYTVLVPEGDGIPLQQSEGWNV